jgi:hypothetical protein
MSDRPTPLTDKEAIQTHGTPLAHYVRDEFARRLELDRAALMEALEFYRQHMLLGYEITDSGQVAEFAISTARANFPTP